MVFKHLILPFFREFDSEDFKSPPSVPWNGDNDCNSSSKESQSKFWGLDEEFADSESLLDELHGNKSYFVFVAEALQIK